MNALPWLYLKLIIWNIYIFIGRPQWDELNNVEVDHECYNTTAILLKISWPRISNADSMDFDFYTLLIEIFDRVRDNVTASTITNKESYMGIFNVTELDDSLMVQVQVNAVNRCKESSNMPLCNDSIPIDKGM